MIFKHCESPGNEAISELEKFGSGQGKGMSLFFLAKLKIKIVFSFLNEFFQLFFLVQDLMMRCLDFWVNVFK